MSDFDIVFNAIRVLWDYRVGPYCCKARFLLALRDATFFFCFYFSAIRLFKAAADEFVY